jgi:hypothetical protein
MVAVPVLAYFAVFSSKKLSFPGKYFFDLAKIGSQI